MLRHRAYIQAARLTFGISGALDEGSDFIPPTEQPIDITPAPAPAAPITPKPRRTPPSPNQGKTIEGEAVKDDPKPEPASETKSQDVSDVAEFDLNGCLDALKAAKTMDELKQIYNDFDPDGNLQDKPTQLEIAQDTFIRMTKRLEREAEKK